MPHRALACILAVAGAVNGFPMPPGASVSMEQTVVLGSQLSPAAHSAVERALSAVVSEAAGAPVVVTRVESTGVVTVKINVVTRNMKQFGYSLPLATNVQAQKF